MSSSSDLTPDQNKRYQEKDYWDERYAKDDGWHEWFKGYQELQPLLDEIVPDRSARILMLGCGNSALSKDMWEAGYKNIVNIDYSSVVIEKMRSVHANMESIQWLEMDIRSLQFEDASFDVVIDKGTMDAILTGVKDVWSPPQDVVESCNAEVSEAIRVLKPTTGVFLYLTFAQPHFRRQYLQREGATFEMRQLGDMFHYYFFIVRKQ
ncbi:S-adenosyl-L-methionine-dependent methyltransferase [Auriculariales sp. MPI-PUGE-AT-0066]|nr:S-adenosyl-L-methionine-dependent methyltransferase [Auriculariales sp. MPI-PUGE-AT-0066]